MQTPVHDPHKLVTLQLPASDVNFLLQRVHEWYQRFVTTMLAQANAQALASPPQPQPEASVDDGEEQPALPEKPEPNGRARSRHANREAT